MLIGIDTNPCLVSEQVYVQLQNDVKLVRTFKLCVQKLFY